MKNITIAQSKDFFKKATEMIIELGAKKVDNHYPFLLDTIAGNLKIKVDKENKHIFSVYTKFENVELAKEKIKDKAPNPFSGKWNFHIINMPVDNVIEIIKNQIELIIKK